MPRSSSRIAYFQELFNSKQTISVKPNWFAVTRFADLPMLAAPNLYGSPTITIFNKQAGLLCVPIPYIPDGALKEPIYWELPTDQGALTRQLAEALSTSTDLFVNDVPHAVLHLPMHPSGIKWYHEMSIRSIHVVRDLLAFVKIKSLTINYYSWQPHRGPLQPQEKYESCLILDGRSLRSDQLPRLHFSGEVLRQVTGPDLSKLKSAQSIPSGVKVQPPQELWLRGIDKPRDDTVQRAESSRHPTSRDKPTAEERGRSRNKDEGETRDQRAEPASPSDRMLIRRAPETRRRTPEEERSIVKTEDKDSKSAVKRESRSKSKSRSPAASSDVKTARTKTRDPERSRSPKRERGT